LQDRVQEFVASDDSGLACSAARWLRAGGAANDAAVHEVCAAPEANMPDRGGTTSSGTSYRFGFGLSSRRGFHSTLDITLEPWLLIAP
jgi:hypothetical protein